MVLGWKFNLSIELTVVQSRDPTFDARLEKTIEKPQISAKKACNAVNKKNLTIGSGLIKSFLKSRWWALMKIFWISIWIIRLWMQSFLNSSTSSSNSSKTASWKNKHQKAIWFIVVYAQNPSFRTTIFFTFQTQSCFKQAAVSLVFLPCKFKSSDLIPPIYFSV